MKRDVFYQDAERLYIRGKTIREISQILGVSERTLSRWKKQGLWDEKRKRYMMNPAGIYEAIEEVLRKKVEELSLLPANKITTKMIDQLSKLVASLEKLRREAALSTQAVVVLDRFAAFIRDKEKSEEFINRLSKHIQQFFKQILKEERRK